MKLILSQFFLLISLSLFSQGQISIADLKLFIGSWEGTITYIDYQTKKPFTMPANVLVERRGTPYQLVLKNSYPNEPKANNTDKMKVKMYGTRLNGHLVALRKELDSGQLLIQTEHKGRDDRQKALIRTSYLVDEISFIIRKEVQFNEDDAWIKRSEYKYKRVAEKAPVQPL